MKRFSSFFVGFFISAIAFSAYAHPLTIENNTFRELTFSFNGICTSYTLDKGTIKISESELNKLCNNFSRNCRIASHENKGCTGKSGGGMIYTSENEVVPFRGHHSFNIIVNATKDSLVFSY